MTGEQRIEKLIGVLKRMRKDLDEAAAIIENAVDKIDATSLDLGADTAIIPPETIANANAPNDMRVVIETKDTQDGFTMNVRTHERGTGYPITGSEESKRIAEAVANTPHSC